MMKVLSTATSGLQAATRRLDASAHNIANGPTDGFKRVVAQANAQRITDAVAPVVGLRWPLWARPPT